MEDLLTNTPTSNKIAFLTFVLAKFSGLIGIVIGFAGFRFWGGSLLALDGILLLVTVILCVLEMNRQKNKDHQNKDALAKMMEDGTIHQRLQEMGFKLAKD